MLVDSNVLIYAINVRSPKNSLAQNFLTKNEQNLHVSHQNIFETLRVLTHKKFEHPMNIKDAIEAVEGITNGCTIISPDNRTHQVTLKLIERYSLSSNQIFDAYLVATALCNDITTIATDNTKDIGKFAQITVINPFVNEN